MTMPDVDMQTLEIIRGIDLADNKTAVLGKLPDGIYVVVQFENDIQVFHRRFSYLGYAHNYLRRLKGPAGLKICGNCSAFRKDCYLGKHWCIAHNTDVSPEDTYSCYQPNN